MNVEAIAHALDDLVLIDIMVTSVNYTKGSGPSPLDRTNGSP